MQVQADFAEFLVRAHAALAAGATVSPNSASDKALSGVTPRITSPGRQPFGGSSKPPAATSGPLRLSRNEQKSRKRIRKQKR